METQQPNQNSQPGQSHNSFLKQLEDFLELYLHKKAPFHLPPNFKEIIVQFGPWLTLILIVAAIPAILIGFGLNTVMLPVAMMGGLYHFGWSFFLHSAIALVTLVMEAIALPGLFKRSIKSWYLVYYAVLVGAVGQLLAGDLFGFIIGTALSMYVLFQVKEYYK